MMRNLVLVFGDQLSENLSALDRFDKTSDRVWMAEVDREATRVLSHKKRLVLFFSAMRHFRDRLIETSHAVVYHQLTKSKHDDLASDFAGLLEHAIQTLSPQKVVMTQPGDWYVLESVKACCASLRLPLEIREDRHFYCSIDEFAEWKRGRKSMILENFYRSMRTRHRILLDTANRPLGDQWNFDKDNRGSFGKSGPEAIPPIQSFAPDSTTRAVIDMVEVRYCEHPGTTDSFDYPVSADQAKLALDDFIKYRLSRFGTYQDAMWSDTAYLYHSRLSAVMNMHLIDPRDAVDAATEALQADNVPIAAVEGFVRQIVGWREFVRGVYWTEMPGYAQRNSLGCDDREVPPSFWTGETEMNCVAESMNNVLQNAYAHHIQRLMVLGLYAQLLGVHPIKFHDWHMAMYADAIDWVSLPNTLGMSQHGDGGMVGTKPYCASGAYVDRMSNYCKSCKFNPKKSTGPSACPITTLYWHFLHRHQETFAKNQRMKFQMSNLLRKDPSELNAILDQAEQLLRDEA